MKLKRALKKLNKALEKDSRYRVLFKARLTETIKEEAKRVMEAKKPNRLCGTDVEKIANQSAENFVDVLKHEIK